MKRKKEHRLLQNLALLNPRNLEKEVHMYGYNFNWKTHILVLICSLIGISAIGVLYKLQTAYFTIINVAMLISLPVFILASYRRMYEQKRFADTATYMEQILYSFQKNGKILAALKETQSTFNDGQMRDVIGQAIAYLTVGHAETEKGVLREALEIIEKPYHCTKIKTVHELLISSEEYGGSAEKSITLLLMDLEGWKRRGYKLQAQKKVDHTNNIASIAVSTGFCAIALYVLDAMRLLYPQVAVDNTIFNVRFIQLSSLLFILFMIYVLAKSQRSLTADWLQPEGLHDDAFLLDSYDTVMNYNESRQKKKSLIFAAPFFVAAILVFIFYKVWLGVVLTLIGAFMLMQHRVGYNLAKKDIDKEMYIALPQWLMEIALLLQSNNVQVSITKSINGAPPVLQQELKLLTMRLREAPGSLKSYTDFCCKFDVPEAASCMRMLHSISEAGTGNADVQINNLLQRVNEMQEQADILRDNQIAFKSKLIFSYPVGAATVKLLIDFTCGVLYMMAMLGNMGGI